MEKKIERSTMVQTDSKGKVTRPAKDGNEHGVVNFRWWNLDEKDMSAAINGTILFMQKHQSRIEKLAEFSRLYGLTSVSNKMGPLFSRTNSNHYPLSQRMSFNLCSSVIDTLESKMAKNQIVPTYITNGGDWSAQKKAKQLTKFTQGLFYAQHMHQKSIYAWKDAAIWGDGLIQIFEKDDKVCMEKAYTHELFVDTIETHTSEPKQLHRVKILDRDVARELLPELSEAINDVSPINFQDVGGDASAVDLITVIESWHLKSGPGAKDGVHVFTVGDSSFAEDYNRDYFPFAHLRYNRMQFGWHGQGACERLSAIQMELNRSMILKQQSLRMCGSFKILVENGSKVVKQHLDNDVATIVTYSGTPPQYVTPPATNPELQAWIDALINYGYSQEGISRMSTTGEAPMGVESGKAMRTLVQISDDRFLFMQQEQEKFVLECARQAVNVAKDIYARTKKYEVIFPDTRFTETIDWGDIALDEEEYVLKAFPTSSLSDDLSGRLSEVQELTQAGMISPRASRRLLDMPDVEASDALANAAEDRLHQIYEKMLDDKEVTRFEPSFHDATLAQQLGLEYVNYAEYMGAPDENIQLVRDFLSQVQTEALSPTPGVVPTAPGAPGVPQANPMPTPQNNLIPNVTGAQ